MKKVLLFDTAIATGNIGDEIIFEGVKAGLAQVLDYSSVYRMGTHIQNYSAFQMLVHKFIKQDRKIRDINEKVDYKFICGTNLLLDDLSGIRPQFMLNLFNKSLYKDAILVGVGRSGDFEKVSNRYSRYLYQKTLSYKYVHSVRDEKTKCVVEELGFKAINTGCPTLWGFTHEFCNMIPRIKAENVICSVSGHLEQRDPVRDMLMIETIRRNYKHVYIWIQTAIDEEYFLSLVGSQSKRFTYIYSLNEFKRIMREESIDYIGTRLHGGIFALQNKVRTIIISIDERAKGFEKSNNIPILERSEISKLECVINGEIITNISVNRKAINTFLEQFI